jgi:predicted ATPase
MNSEFSNNKGHHRIVVTGGPGGGKTTAADLFRRELGDCVVIVPEAATMLFSGGFPRSREQDATESIQQAIYHVQKSSEDVQAALYPLRTLLCDRGTIDGAAYWPKDDSDFFEHMNTSLEDELRRYDAVIFFETAAVGGLSIEGGNPVRQEGLKEAIALDQKLKDLWSQHPNFIFVPHKKSFFEKITYGLNSIQNTLTKLQDQ